MGQNGARGWCAMGMPQIFEGTRKKQTKRWNGLKAAYEVYWTNGGKHVIASDMRGSIRGGGAELRE